MKTFRGVSVLKKTALNIFVKMLNSSDILELKNTFSQLDVAGTGMITKKELKESLTKANLPISDKDINSMFEQVDLNGDEKINYSEFIAATISVKNFLDEKKIKAIFKQFDTDNSGEITSDDIVNAMNKLD